MLPAVSTVILATKVIRTPVRNEREWIGHVENVAISKRDGKIAFAILSIGGFLGLGGKFHPVPRNALISIVRWRTKRSRVRWSTRPACCSGVFTGTKRMDGRLTASREALPRQRRRSCRT